MTVPPRTPEGPMKPRPKAQKITKYVHNPLSDTSVTILTYLSIYVFEQGGVLKKNNCNRPGCTSKYKGF